MASKAGPLLGQFTDRLRHAVHLETAQRNDDGSTRRMARLASDHLKIVGRGVHDRGGCYGSKRTAQPSNIDA